MNTTLRPVGAVWLLGSETTLQSINAGGQNFTELVPIAYGASGFAVWVYGDTLTNFDIVLEAKSPMAGIETAIVTPNIVTAGSTAGKQWKVYPFSPPACTQIRFKLVNNGVGAESFKLMLTYGG